MNAITSSLVIICVLFCTAEVKIPEATGSNETSPFLLECRRPEAEYNNSVQVNLTQEEFQQLQTEGRCFLACALNKFRSQVRV